MRFFGKPQDMYPSAQTPIGATCAYCAEPIAAGDEGFLIPTASIDGELIPSLVQAPEHPWHKECFLRQIYGSVGHQRGWCDCHGGIGDGEPKGVSRRLGARMAVAAHWCMNEMPALLRDEIRKGKLNEP